MTCKNENQLVKLVQDYKLKKYQLYNNILIFINKITNSNRY